MPQSLSTAEYVAMAVVIVPCLFFMALIPLIVNLCEERRSRQHPAASVVEDRHLPQAGWEYGAAQLPHARRGRNIRVSYSPSDEARGLR